MGQDLRTLGACGEWIKVMAYGHTVSPAGLPFELLGLANWLIEEQAIDEPQALELISNAAGLPLPRCRAALCEQGLSPEALAGEVARARSAGVETLLAGIELVEMTGITHLTPDQITADLAAFRRAGADGLVLSWDLWRIPMERLDLVAAIWC